jgi:hypothetical protein
MEQLKTQRTNFASSGGVGRRIKTEAYCVTGGVAGASDVVISADYHPGPQSFSLVHDFLCHAFGFGDSENAMPSTSISTPAVTSAMMPM